MCLQLLSSFLILAAAVLSWNLFLLIEEGDHFLIPLTGWISIGTLESIFSLNLDKLTALMFVVVNTVSSVVHLYSIGYMKGDPHKSRFFCYLSLFTFAMLILVSANDFLQLFLGWEGVGVCSYLLIGFWFEKESANAASMKAFIVNRVGDFCFLIGIFSIYKIFGTFEFSKVFLALSSHSADTIFGFHSISFICMALFIGCMSKSAQLGLHTWLPDAMEGPTPVSALIHAATMVTAGVFLIVKLSYLFEFAPLVRDVVLWVGVFTAVFGAVVAFCQNDIKKIIAYSTCSQLGYMFAACGASAYGAAIFHLSTHAFFKALLFLCAGNVIHSVGGEQDIRKMGDLKGRLLSTCCMMLVGSLALCGVFPLAGFYSKDLIIFSLSTAEVPFILLILTACCTSLYSCKLVALVFFGKQNFDSKKFHSPSMVMVLTLLPLVILSVISGYYGTKLLLRQEFWSETGLVFRQIKEVHGIAHFTPVIFVFAGGFLVFISRKLLFDDKKISWITLLSSLIFFSFLCFLLSPYLALALMIIFGSLLLIDRRDIVLTYLEKILRNKLYFDEGYKVLLVKPLLRCSGILWKVFDVACIDFIPTLFVKFSSKLSSSVLGLQTGLIYHNALFLVLGILLLLWIV